MIFNPKLLILVIDWYVNNYYNLYFSLLFNCILLIDRLLYFNYNYLEMNKII